MAKKTYTTVSEDTFQINTVIPALKQVLHLSAYFIQNEASFNHKGVGARRKAMGINPGIADILVMDLKTKTIDFLELKRYQVDEDGNYKDAGTWSDAQKDFSNMCEFIGGRNELCKYYLIRNPDDLNEYLKEKRS